LSPPIGRTGVVGPFGLGLIKRGLFMGKDEYHYGEIERTAPLKFAGKSKHWDFFQEKWDAGSLMNQSHMIKQ